MCWGVDGSCLLTASMDQTCRITTLCQGQWCELARPQVLPLTLPCHVVLAGAALPCLALSCDALVMVMLTGAALLCLALSCDAHWGRSALPCPALSSDSCPAIQRPSLDCLSCNLSVDAQPSWLHGVEITHKQGSQHHLEARGESCWHAEKSKVHGGNLSCLTHSLNSSCLSTKQASQSLHGAGARPRHVMPCPHPQQLLLCQRGRGEGAAGVPGPPDF